MNEAKIIFCKSYHKNVAVERFKSLNYLTN